MKLLAYTLYVVTVLLISGFARANAATVATHEVKYDMPVTITKVSMDSRGALLLISGSLPNPCYGNPTALLTQDAKDPSILVVRLSSAVPNGTCIDSLKTLDTSVALSSLVHASRVNLDGDVTYLLKVDGTDFATQIHGSDLIK